jgi:hypothetical protein
VLLGLAADLKHVIRFSGSTLDIENLLAAVYSGSTLDIENLLAAMYSVIFLLAALCFEWQKNNNNKKFPMLL